MVISLFVLFSNMGKETPPSSTGSHNLAPTRQTNSSEKMRDLDPKIFTVLLNGEIYST